MRTTTRLLPLLAGLLLAAPCGAQTVTYRKADFDGGTPLTPLHRGINLTILGEGLQWSADAPADPDFYSVAADPDFRALVRALDVGSVRIPGGSESNYHDFTDREGWVSWALGNERTHNATVDWSAWWSFHEAIGRPRIVTTANPFTDGNPAAGDRLPAEVSGEWVATYARERGIRDALWEAGNETYIGDLVPGMAFTTGGRRDPLSYPSRASELADAVHAADPTARVGLVVYEHGTRTSWCRTDTLLSDVEMYGDASDFEFLVLHDYAPLVPREEEDGDRVFRATGVAKTLAYLDLVDPIRDLEPLAGGRPILVTEYGLLLDDGGRHWVSGWYDRGVALLLMYHWLEQVDEGAGGLWFWDAISKWFRLVDPTASPPRPTAAYRILDRLHSLSGRLRGARVRGSPTFEVAGPIGTGLWEGEADSSAWYLARSSSEAPVRVDRLRSFAAFDCATGRLQIVLMNFGGQEARIDVALDGFGLSGTVAFERWLLRCPGAWNDPLGEPTVSRPSRTVARVGTVATLEQVRVPRRSAVLLEIPVP